MATKQSGDRLAVLIDADQGQNGVLQELMSEISRYGTATIKRAYGDWTEQNMSKWKGSLQANAIQPVQQFRYTKGKNATDSALIIDAMDVLHSNVVDGFCLVSSDSDFTRLATRIREAGLAVYGFGERKTPAPFVAACDKFIYLEILTPEVEVQTVSVQTETKEPAAVAEADEPAIAQLPDLQPVILGALEKTARDDGWSSLAALGGQISRDHSSFDPRNYSYKRLSELVRAQPYLQIKEVPSGENGLQLHLHVRRKPTV
jgi:uncharacterized LabA/DUF88 family protein